MTTILYTAQVCTCCASWLANRDNSGCDRYCDESEHPAGLMSGFDQSEGYAVIGMPSGMHADGCAARNGDECEWDCETVAFTRNRCDGCRSELAGTRVAVTVLS